MAGRRPIPTALKVIQGTFRPGKANQNEAKPPAGIPESPNHLSADALEEWNRIAPQLETAGLLTCIDMAALAAYCQLYARWQKAEREIEQHGETITTPNGSLQVSPWLSISSRALAELRRYAVEFGLTPASRSKTTAAPKKEAEKKGKYSKL